MASNLAITSRHLLVAALLLGLSSCSNDSVGGDSNGDAIEAPDVAAAPPSGGKPIESVLPTPRPSRPGPISFKKAEARAKEEALLKSYQCHADKCASEALGASTVAEASWLQSRGFPTPDHEADLENMSLSQLQLSADNGDLAAKAILGRRLMENGDTNEGLERLIDAASHGSVYADYQRSQALRSSNMYESAAFLRRAYLQGDVKAATIMYQQFPLFMTPEWANVDKQAMKLYEALLVQRANKGSMPFGPRP